MMLQSDLWSLWKYNTLQVVLDDPRIPAESLIAQMLLFLFRFVGPLSFRLKVVSLAFVCRCCVLQQVVMLHFVLLWRFCLCPCIFPSVQESHLLQ